MVKQLGSRQNYLAASFLMKESRWLTDEVNSKAETDLKV
jgi:hypothetical protein